MGTIKETIFKSLFVLVTALFVMFSTQTEGMAQHAANPGAQVPPGPPDTPPGHDRHPPANEVGDIKWSFKNVDHGDWLLCDGRAFSRVGEAALFAEIGTTFGAGDGSTTFNVADCRGRSLMAENNAGLPGMLDLARASRFAGGMHGGESNISALPLHLHLAGSLVAMPVPPHSHGPGTLTASGGPAHTHSLSGAGGTITGFVQGEDSDPDVNYLVARSTDRGGTGISVPSALSLAGSTGLGGGGGGGPVVGTTGLTGLPPASVSGATAIAGVAIPDEPNVHPVSVLGNVFVYAP